MKEENEPEQAFPKALHITLFFFSQEWGRASFDIRHWFNAGASYQTRSGFSVNTFIIANSGPPFNITTGHDTNGDTFFTERPALATDLNKPGVIVTV